MGGIYFLFLGIHPVWRRLSTHLKGAQYDSDVLSKEALSLEMGKLSYIEMLDGESIGSDTIMFFSFMLFNIAFVAYSYFLENIQVLLSLWLYSTKCSFGWVVFMAYKCLTLGRIFTLPSRCFLDKPSGLIMCLFWLRGMSFWCWIEACFCKPLDYGL